MKHGEIPSIMDSVERIDWMNADRLLIFLLEGQTSFLNLYFTGKIRETDPSIKDFFDNLYVVKQIYNAICKTADLHNKIKDYFNTETVKNIGCVLIMDLEYQSFINLILPKLNIKCVSEFKIDVDYEIMGFENHEGYQYNR